MALPRMRLGGGGGGASFLIFVIVVLISAVEEVDARRRGGGWIIIMLFGEDSQVQTVGVIILIICISCGCLCACLKSIDSDDDRQAEGRGRISQNRRLRVPDEDDYELGPETEGLTPCPSAPTFAPAPAAYIIDEEGNVRGKTPAAGTPYYHYQILQTSK